MPVPLLKFWPARTKSVLPTGTAAVSVIARVVDAAADVPEPTIVRLVALAAASYGPVNGPPF